MSDYKKENQRLRDALCSIAEDATCTPDELRRKAENALKVIPFPEAKSINPDDTLLLVVKIHRDKIETLEETIKSMINFFKIWKVRELKMGNYKIAEAIQLTIESYACRK